MTPVSRNSKGFTLLEVLVSLLVLAVVLLGNLAVLNLAQRWNLKNVLRNEALALAKRCLYSSCSNTNVTVRGMNVEYSINITSCSENSTLLNDLGLNCKRIVVRWNDPYGESHSVNLTAYVP